LTVQSWLETALADAEARGLIDLKPLLRSLADATTLLRRADWNKDAERGEAQNAAAPRRWVPGASGDEQR
jgi:hypothetical protein